MAGIFIGLMVAFGAWKTAKVLKPKPTAVAKKETPQPRKVTEFMINSHKNYDVVSDDPIIKGQAEAGNKIVIMTEDSDYITSSDANGVYEIKIAIPAGISRVTLKNLSTQEEKELILIYSTEVEPNSTAYVGTVTDISSGAIQVKVSSGGIAQVSSSIETKIINTLKKNAEIKESDIAIGDYIISMGKSLQNKVLLANRILVTSPISSSKFKIEKIKIEKLTKTSINDITLPKKWNGPDIKELEVGQEIYIVGTTTDNKFDLRSIFVIE